MANQSLLTYNSKVWILVTDSSLFSNVTTKKNKETLNELFSFTKPNLASSWETNMIRWPHGATTNSGTFEKNFFNRAKEEEENALNHQYDTISHEPLLGSDYPTSSYSDLVTGDKHTANFLKELSKTKHELEQYKGVNDQLLANSVPGTTSGPASEKIKQNNVNILSKTNNPDPRTK